MRVLTLENMDDVNLQGTFNYKAFSFIPFLPKIVEKLRRRLGAKDKIKLGEVYRLFEQGLQFHEVKDALTAENFIFNRDIQNKTVLLGQAFYRAVNPGIKHFNRSNIIKALCDENIDEYQATDGAQRVFGYASHTSFSGLTGKPDSLVWLEGLNFDVIISKDTAQKSNLNTFETRDLTNCAEDAWKDVLSRNGGVIDDEVRSLPIIIHIKDASATGREIRALLKKHKTDIYNLIQQRKSPVIELKKGRRPQIGKHYLELINGDREEKRRILIEKRFRMFCKIDHLNLGDKVIREYAPTIRDLIANDVDKIMFEQKKNAEVLMHTLNDCIDRVEKIGTMTIKAQHYLTKQINNAKPQRNFQVIQKARREELYSRKPHLRPILSA